MPIKTSQHSGYDKIFPISVGNNGSPPNDSRVISQPEGQNLPPHRALLISVSGSVSITFTNLNSTTTFTWASSTTEDKSFILPIQVKTYSVTSGSSFLSLYGLS
jgi:hypothetical protein